MSKLTRTTAITFLFAFLYMLPSSAQFLPKPPDTGTPSGNPTPGTSRPEANCPELPSPVTLAAIVANNGKDFTLSAHPTLWFYVPYRATELSQIEFLLLSGNERETIYQKTIQLPAQPGVIQVTIPQDTKYALQPNQTYRWRLNLDCKSDRTVEPDVSIDGWIRRVPLNAQLTAQLKSSNNDAQVYRDHQIWYDAIDETAKQYFANSSNPKMARAWSELLKTLGVSWIQVQP